MTTATRAFLALRGQLPVSFDVVDLCAATGVLGVPLKSGDRERRHAMALRCAAVPHTFPLLETPCRRLCALHVEEPQRMHGGVVDEAPRRVECEMVACCSAECGALPGTDGSRDYEGMQCGRGSRSRTAGLRRL